MFDLYRALVAESEARRLPEAFETDLTTHDRAFIARKPTAEFVWLLYECGTHVVRIDGPGDTLSVETATRLFHDLARDGKARMYHATPTSLTEVTAHQLRERILGREAA